MDGPRACRESEFEETISLINRVFREGADQDIRTDYPIVFNPSQTEYMRIIKVDGKVVAQVPVVGREVVAPGDRFTIGIISPTVTHPDYRRKGYATLCLRDCIRKMEEKDWPVSVLWTAIPTFPFYQHSDYEAVAPQGWMYRLCAKDHHLFEPGAFEIVRYDPAKTEHLDAIMRIHNAEPYRILRSRGQYEALFSLPKITTYLAVKGKEITAYLMFGKAMNKPGLIEGGGSMAALESLVGYVLAQQTADQGTQVLVPLTPNALKQLLDTKMPGTRGPIEEADGVGHQMMRINSLEKLLQSIKHYLRKKSLGLDGDVCLMCTETGERVTLKFHDGDIRFSAQPLPDPVVLSRRQLVQLVFGARPTAEPVTYAGKAREILETVFPYYFSVWELDHS